MLDRARPFGFLGASAAVLVLVLLVGSSASASRRSSAATQAATIVPAVQARALGRYFGIIPAGRVGTRPTSSQFAGTSLASTANLSYNGGPVMRTNKAYAIYWIPGGYSVSSGYTSLIDRYFGDVAAASGTTGNVYASDTQYYDTTGPIAYAASFGGSVVDTNPLPASACSDRYTSVCLTDAQIRSEIQREVAANPGWQVGPSSVFFMYTAKGVGSCLDSTGSQCAFSYYCAYHSNIGSGSNEVLYANMPYADTVASACDAGQHPNANDADATLNLVSHEHNETITDPLGTGWYDSQGNENGDKCAWNFGSPLGSTGSGQYNQVINGHQYYLQQEWSNASSSCVQTYAPAAGPPTVSGFAPASGPVGTSVTISGTNLGGASNVSFTASAGAVSATITADSPGSVSATVPSGAISGPIGVTTPGGTALSSTSFTVTVAPANTALPVISGTAQVGQALTTSSGSWSGTAPIAYAYQWRRCNSSGGSCNDVTGATATSYTLQSADQGSTVLVRVTASNGAGSANADSAAVGPVVAAGPQTMTFSTVAGGDDGNATVNDMTGSSGGTPAPYPPTGSATATLNGASVGVRRSGPLFGGYEVRLGLLRFDTSALPDNATVTGASLKLYVTSAASADGRSLVGEWYDPANWPIDAADYTTGAATTALAGTAIQSLSVNQLNTIGLQNLGSVSTGGYTALRLAISGGQPSGENGLSFAGFENGSQPAAQLVVSYTTPSQGAPQNTALPTVSGTAQVGSQLSATTGSWTNSPSSYTYGWESASAASGPWSPIVGAGSSTYTTVSGDANRYLHVVVTASNGSGSASAASAAVGPVVAAGPQTLTFSTVAGGDDGNATVNDMTGSSGGTPAPYPPTGSATATLDGTTVGVRRSGPLFGGYEVRVALLRFDTSALPDNATVTGASLKLYVTSAASADGRSLVGEWYDPANWPIDAADYTTGAATTALAGTAIQSLAVNQLNTIGLQNLGSVSTGGYTALRLAISGGQPSGENGLSFAGFENGSQPAAQLTITYTLP